MFDALNTNAGCNAPSAQLCRHCGHRKAHVNRMGYANHRGLCNGCYTDRAVRDLYPARNVNRKPAGTLCESCGGFMPATVCPVCWIANPVERETLRTRLDLYGLRAAAGLPLFDGLPPITFDALEGMA